MNDYRVKEYNKKEFDSRGWTVINLGLNINEIERYQKSLIEIRRKLLGLNVAPRRVYYDHLSRFNMAAIELPFNSICIDENIIELFNKIKLGSLVCTLMNWEKAKSNLARLFCMNNYNYRGRWHRDFDNISAIQSPSSCHDLIIAALYLFEQSGFRVLKKEYDLGGRKSLIVNEEMDNLICNHNMPISPPSYSYDVLKAPAGSVIFINPLLLHQGTNYGSRLDYHILFNQDNDIDSCKNYFQDFTVKSFLLKEYKFLQDLEGFGRTYRSISHKEIPFAGREKISTRFLNSINYRLPILNIYQQYKYFYKSFGKIGNKKLNWEPELLSNTMWQRE